MTRTEDEARRYLLGHLSDEASQALERAYFADPTRVDEVAAAESELVDAYVAGALSAADRDAFESHYLASPVHRDRVETARLLLRARPLRGTAPRRVAAVRVAWLAAAAVLAGLALWWSRPPGPPGPSASVASGPSPEPAATASAPPPPATVPGVPKRSVALALGAIGARGDEQTPELRLPADADEVALELGRAGDPPAGTLSFAVRTVEGASVAGGRLERRGGAVLGIARVPAARLPPDDYIVAVSSAREPAVAQYFFRVVP
jgi:hypothetical protein